MLDNIKKGYEVLSNERDWKEEIMLNVDIEGIREVIRDIISYNGSLDYLEVYENEEEFFNTFFSNSYELARAISYGSYNYMDEYVRIIDVYGNIESISLYDYELEVKDYLDDIVNNMVEEWDNISEYLENNELVMFLYEVADND